MGDEKKSLGERVAEWSRSPEGIAAMMRDDGGIISAGSLPYRVMEEWSETMKRLASGPSALSELTSAHIAQAAALHNLTESERFELADAVSRWPESSFHEAFAESLDNILAARELAKMPPITAEDMDAIRKAVDAGLLPGPEFLAAADVEADTPITVRPPLTDAEKNSIRDAIRRSEESDAADPENVARLRVFEELVRENQEWGMYDNPPGPRTGKS